MVKGIRTTKIIRTTTGEKGTLVGIGIKIRKEIIVEPIIPTTQLVLNVGRNTPMNVG